jgi:hypothetical protein
MGRVFQYSEIEAGLVPNAADFQVAANTFRDAATNAVESGTVLGAFVFGSASALLTGHPRIAPNSRSDFDCFVVIQDYTEESIRAVKDIAENTRDATNHKIPIVPIVYLKKHLENGDKGGMHEIDEMFGVELRGSNRHVIGEDPATYMRFPRQAVSDIFNNFVAQKRRKLHNGFSHEPQSEQGVRYVQRLLELPISVGRKAIQALVLDGSYILDDSFTASDKKQVIQITAEVLLRNNDQAIEWMGSLVENEYIYNHLLGETLEGRISESTYGATLQELTDTRTGIMWLNCIHTALSSRLAVSV